MPSICPYCSLANFEQATTCTHCGAQLQASSKGKVTGSFTKLAHFTEVPQTPLPPILSPSGEEQRLSLPISDALPALSMPLTAPLSQSEPHSHSTSYDEPDAVRRILKGCGTTVAHRSWFLDGRHTETHMVYAVLEEEARHRKLEDIMVASTPEEPHYVLLCRKAATIFISATSIGDNLYVARMSAIRLPISVLRCVAIALLTLFVGVAPLGMPTLLTQLHHMPWLLATLTSSQYSGMLSDWFVTSLIILLCLLTYIPALAFFLVTASRSIHSWLQQGDPLDLLRTRHLQPYQRDEIALLEHLADDIIRSTARHLGLDASQIRLSTPSNQEHQYVNPL